MGIEIITPGRFLEGADPVNFGITQQGFFTLEAVGRSGRVRRSVRFPDSVGPFPNLILNQGLDRFGTEGGPRLYSRFWVGTGTKPVDPTDTSLMQPVGGSMGIAVADASDVGNSGPPDYYTYRRFAKVSEVGQFGNANLTEVGIGYTQADSLFSRALIVDATGNPTAFPIGDDEQLRITYELRIYPPLQDQHFEVDIVGLRQVTVRPLAVSTASQWAPTAINSNTPGPGIVNYTSVRPYDGGLSDITASTPQGGVISSMNSGTHSTFNYDPGSYRLGFRRIWGSTNGSSDQITTMDVTLGSGKFQVMYDPPLAKTDTQTMYLDFETSWGRR